VGGVGVSGLRQQHKAYSDKLAKTVAILQCYVAYIYSAPGPDLPTVAELTGLIKLNSQALTPCRAEASSAATTEATGLIFRASGTQNCNRGLPSVTLLGNLRKTSVSSIN
jgi:hypothetical protein